MYDTTFLIQPLDLLGKWINEAIGKKYIKQQVYYHYKKNNDELLI